MTAQVLPMLEPDPGVIFDHLEHLMRAAKEYCPSALVQIDHGHPVITKDWGHQFFGLNRLEAATEFAASTNRQGLNLYVGVNPRKAETRRSATDDDIECAFFNFADIDRQEAVQRVSGMSGLNYTFAVTTGRVPNPRPHLYWKLNEPTRNFPAWTKQQAAIADALGGDRVIDPRRIMRLAGTVNYPKPDKAERGYRTELVTLRTVYDGEERDPVDSEWLRKRFPWEQEKASESLNLSATSGLNTDQIISELRTGGAEWHNQLVLATASWVSRGFTNEEILTLCETLTRTGFSISDTRREIGVMVEGARRKFGKPNPVALIEDQQPSTLGEWDASALPDFTQIKPRGWLLGNQFCRGFLSSLLGAGAIGKSVVRKTQYLSLATGRPLSGEHVFHRSRVLIVSLEDNRNELERRLAAAMIHHRIDRGALAGWLYLASPTKLKLAHLKDGAPETGELDRLIRTKVEELRLDLVAFDPFVKAHGVPENDNNAIDFVTTLMARIAIECNVACDAPHHIKKGIPVAGDADAGRGASAFKDGGRLIYTLTAMTPEEGALMGVADKERRSLVRLDNAKVNLAPSGADTTWFRILGVRIGNATPEYPQGDEIQAAEPWSAPGIFDGISNSDLNGILDVIEAGMPGGERFSRRFQDAGRWAGTVIAEGLKVDVEQAKAIVSAWMKTGLLFEETYESPGQRKTRKCVRVDNSKRPGTSINV